MSEVVAPIELRMVVIGCFDDDSLKYNERSLEMDNAAVIQFVNKSDAQAFAKAASFEFQRMIVKVAPELQEPPDSE